MAHRSRAVAESLALQYLRAKLMLRDLRNVESKITEKARHRMAAHTIAEQLEAHAEELRKEFRVADQDDIDTAFAADKSWSGQRARLSNSKGWDTDNGV